MAEAIGLGASVVAFIGLAGQLAQGCSYVRTTIDDIRDAHDDLLALQREMRLFEATIETFQKGLSGLEDSGIPGHQEPAVQMALDHCEKTMESLLKFVLKKKKNEGRWGQVRFVFDKGKCAKYVGQVERAKGYLAAAQAGILLSLGQEQTLNNRVTHRALGLLASNLEATSNTIEKIPPNLDRISVVTRNIHGAVDEMRYDFSDRLQELPTAIDTILTGKFNAFTSMVSEALGGLDEVRHTRQQTIDATQKLTAVSDGLKCLPKELSRSVHLAFRSVLDDFYWKSQTRGPSFCDFAKKYPQSELRGSSRQVVSQHRTTRRYRRAIGIITVHSITTTFIGPINHNYFERQNPRSSTVTQTYLELYPNPDLIRVGVYSLIAQHGFAIFQSAPEPELRVYNLIDSTAPIVGACRKGDLRTVRTLFSSGQASPFDRIWGEKSLLDLVILQIIQQSTNLPGLIEVFEDLVNHGLDPGVPRASDDLFSKSIIGALGQLAISFPKKTPQFLTLARVVLKNSIHDPFRREDILHQALLSHVNGVKTPLLILMQTQEEWHTDWPPLDNFEECRNYFLRSEALGSLIYSRRTDPRFWDILYYRYSNSTLLQQLFNGHHGGYNIWEGKQTGSTFGDWASSLLEAHSSSRVEALGKGWVWLFHIMELPQGLTNYHAIGKGIMSYSIEGSNTLCNTLEEEHYTSLACQLIFLSKRIFGGGYNIKVPESVQYFFLGRRAEDIFFKQWINEYPQAHDQYGRFGPVNLEKVYSTLHQPFQDEEPERFYYESPLEFEYSESYRSSDYVESKTPDPIFEWEEDYCLEALFSPPYGNDSTSKFFPVGARRPSNDESITQRSHISNSLLNTGNELFDEPTRGKFDAGGDTSKPQDEAWIPRTSKTTEGNFKPQARKKHTSKSHEEKLNTKGESKPDSEEGVEDLQLFMDFLSL